VDAAYLPAAQSLQEPEAAEALNLPEAQSTQSELALVPVVLTAFPAGQSVHV